MTRVLLLERLSQSFNDWWSQASTAVGSTTTTVDSKLAQLSADDDFCLNWYIRKVATDEVRRITGGYLASTNTITHAAFPAAVGNAATYELHRIDPTLKHNALLRASVLCFPNGARHGLYIPLRDEPLVGDNLVSNFDFETFAGGAFTGWDSVGSPTLTQNTSYFVHGSNAANIAGAASTGISQNLLTVANGFARIDQAAGRPLHIRGWLRATDASNIRLRVTFDGSTYTNGSYHSGDDDWEGPTVHTIDVSIPTNATQMTVSIEKSTGVAAQADMVIAWINPVHRYTIPSSILRGPFQVLQQAYMDRPNGPYVPIAAYATPTPGRLLRLTGMGLLSQPTTDAGTVEIDTNQAEYFLAQASQWLYRALVQGGSQQERDYMKQLRQEWQQDIALMERNGTTMPNMAAERPMGVWRVEEEAGIRNLIFAQGR